MELTNDQKQALVIFNTFMTNPKEKIMVLKGYSGTGKTTLLKYIIDNINNQIAFYSSLIGVEPKKFTILATATTNKAAAVLNQIINKNVITIHKLLGLQLKQDYRTGKEKLVKTRYYSVKSNALLIVDEASFVDQKLLKYIEEATFNCKLLFVGDPAQLTPITMSSCPVFDLNVPTAELKEVVRTKNNNSDITNISTNYRNAVLNKKFPKENFNGKDIIQVTKAQMPNLLNKEFTGSNTVKVLAWTNNKVLQYNNYIRKIKNYKEEFNLNEKVILNNHIPGIPVDSEVIITNIGEEEERLGIKGKSIILDDGYKTFLPNDLLEAKQALKHYAKHKEWETYFQIKNEWADLRSSYSCTVHKSQGSTYDKVFLDLKDITSCNIPAQIARMLYVAISRASQQVYIYGSLPDKYIEREY